MIDRRTYLRTVAAAALIRASRANAQRVAKLPRIALVFISSPVADANSNHPLARALDQGLRELGWIEGRNLLIDRRSAAGRFEALPGIMRELVDMQVDVIVSIGLGVGAAIQATATIPIVAVATDDLDRFGAAASLARPGGNVTGLSGEIGVDINGKRLQLLKQAAPLASRVAYLGQAFRPSHRSWRPATEAAAAALGLTLHWVPAVTPDEFDTAFAAVANQRADSLCVDGVTYVHTRSIAAYASQRRLPSIFAIREGCDAGGLMSYGSNLADLFRRAASFVDKILKGAKPGELPIEQPRKFEMVINLKTASALGLTIPQSLLIQADEVIQ